MRQRLPDEATLLDLLAESKRQRETAYHALRHAINGPRYTEFLLRMELWLTKGIWEAADVASSDPLDRPITDFAADALDRRQKKLLKLGGKKAKLEEAEFHDLRLEFKKMRYLSEFFSSLFAKKAVRRYLKSMAEAQDRLGSLNDALVSRSLLGQLEQSLHDSLGELETRRLGALLLGWQAACIERDLAHFEDVWRDFRKQKRYWRKR